MCACVRARIFITMLHLIQLLVVLDQRIYNVLLMVLVAGVQLSLHVLYAQCIHKKDMKKKQQNSVKRDKTRETRETQETSAGKM